MYNNYVLIIVPNHLVKSKAISTLKYTNMQYERNVSSVYLFEAGEIVTSLNKRCQFVPIGTQQ